MPDVPDLPRAAAALRTQWATLRGWLSDVVAVADVPLAEVPSVLPGWSVADLVAHVGRAMDALTAASPAPDGTAPLSLGRYVGGYAAAAAAITETTRELAGRIEGDPLAGIDALAAAAFDRLDGLGHDRVVMARRGPVRLADLVLSRVIELVVHADDLARSVHHPGPAPLNGPALDLVAAALLDVLVERTGGPAPSVTDPLAWVRLACGRVPADVDAVRDAVHPSPRGPTGTDVAAALPLL